MFGSMPSCVFFQIDHNSHIICFSFVIHHTFVISKGYNFVCLLSTFLTKIYVMGAANAGKSSFINRLLEKSYGEKNSRRGLIKGHSHIMDTFTPQTTVSSLPGTTLDFIKMKLSNGVTMIDTPGLIKTGQLTSKLNPDELKNVIPNVKVNPITLRVTEGKCVMIGGLAIMQLVDSRPFFFTFFVSNKIKLHPTSASRVKEVREEHAGKAISPPASYSRIKEIGPYEEREINVSGKGWKSSASDIVIAGLGWISITGAGPCKVKITVPVGTSVYVRPALMPFEVYRTTATFTGGKFRKRGRK